MIVIGQLEERLATLDRIFIRYVRMLVSEFSGLEVVMIL